jgi:arginyl-tRNA synthetase
MSIFDKLGDEFNATGIDINDVAEKELATKLMQFEDALMVVASEATPHALCAYLYDLASSFMRFYEACPILKSDVEASVRDSRLGLAQLTANTLNTGLTLLGIETANRM